VPNSLEAGVVVETLLVLVVLLAVLLAWLGLCQVI